MRVADDLKTQLVVASVDIALEHHEAIGLLAKSQLYGSAFALVRVVWEAMLRALWINKVASSEQIERASRDEWKWNMTQVHIDIKKAYSPYMKAEEVDPFFEQTEEVWEAACSYTHSGALQLARRFTFDELKPDYSEGAIAQALNLATMAHVLLLPRLLLSMGYIQEVDDANAGLAQYNVHFEECPPTE